MRSVVAGVGFWFGVVLCVVAGGEGRWEFVAFGSLGTWGLDGAEIMAAGGELV